MPNAFLHNAYSVRERTRAELEAFNQLIAQTPNDFDKLLGDRFGCSLSAFHLQGLTTINFTIATTLKKDDTFAILVPVMEAIEAFPHAAEPTHSPDWKQEDTSHTAGRQFTLTRQITQSLRIIYRVCGFVPEGGTDNCEVHMTEIKRDPRTDITYTLICKSQ